MRRTYSPRTQRLPVEILLEERYLAYGNVGLRISFEALGTDGCYHPIRGHNLLLTLSKPGVIWSVMTAVKIAVREWLS